MAVWKYRIDVSLIWNMPIPFEAIRDGIVTCIRGSLWYKDFELKLEPLMEELDTSIDGDEFDVVWNRVYDLADETRCWIAT